MSRCGVIGCDEAAKISGRCIDHYWAEWRAHYGQRARTYLNAFRDGATTSEISRAHGVPEHEVHAIMITARGW